LALTRINQTLAEIGVWWLPDGKNAEIRIATGSVSL
jgi:hypothetical protein